MVILGLLTGGILTGQNLIRAAEMRSVTTQLSQYQTAVYTFRDKYFALPGDMTNATDFWGAETSCPDTASTSTATCNGNGNGLIGNNNSGMAAENYEMFRAWQHLANAGLIEGSFTGVGQNISGGIHNNYSAGVNSPAAKISTATFSIRHLRARSSDPNWFDDSYGNVVLFGENGGNAHAPVLSPEEAWGVDKKLDDGKPAYGKILTYKASSAVGYSPGCATSDSSATAEYSLTDKSILCALIFKTGF